MDYEQIYTEGISKITDVDFRYAKALGKSIKLFGFSRMTDDGVTAWTAPVMIGPDNPLYAVSGVINGILVESDMLGRTLLPGSGAGKLRPGRAVVAAIIEAVLNPEGNRSFGWGAERAALTDFDDSIHRYFVRIEGKSETVLKKAREAFGDTELTEVDDLDEFALITPEMKESDYRQKAQGLPVVAMIRVEL